MRCLIFKLSVKSVILRSLPTNPNKNAVPLDLLCFRNNFTSSLKSALRLMLRNRFFTKCSCDFYLFGLIILKTMVQKYQSPVRVYKYPFELVMAVSTNLNCCCLMICQTVSSHSVSNVPHSLRQYISFSFKM